ncbi:MAG: hypothetical protein KF793_01945 [Nitrospira sp.]|nr:hypothetical protein [Nitrospira sp.]
MVEFPSRHLSNIYNALKVTQEENSGGLWLASDHWKLLSSFWGKIASAARDADR